MISAVCHLETEYVIFVKKAVERHVWLDDRTRCKECYIKKLKIIVGSRYGYEQKKEIILGAYRSL